MATKIKKSTIRNIKSIDEFTAELNGATAYIIGGNTKGKTTFIRFLFNRLSSSKTNDSSVLKDKEKEGITEIEMTDGSKFQYIIQPNDKEKLIYVTNENIPVKATRDIIEKYIAKPFDIDKFLNMMPKEKVSYMLKIFDVNIDDLKTKLNDLNSQKKIYADLVNKKKVLLDNLQYVEKEVVDPSPLYEEKRRILDEYNKATEEIREKNKKLREEYNNKYNELFQKLLLYNNEVNNRKREKADLETCINILSSYKDKYSTIVTQLKEHWESIIVGKEKTVEQLKEYMGEFKEIELPPYPTGKINEIEKKIQEIEEQNKQVNKKQEYEILLNDYNNAVKVLNDVEQEIISVNEEIRKSLLNIALPKPLSIDLNNIYYDNRPIDKEHLSTAELYIASLLLSSINLKELRVAYFDCSPLDKESMKLVIDFAKEKDIQLLIEKPDYDAGELRYEIVED